MQPQGYAGAQEPTWQQVSKGVQVSKGTKYYKHTHTQLSHGKGYLSSSVICTNHPLMTSWPRAAIMSLSLVT